MRVNDPALDPKPRDDARAIEEAHPDRSRRVSTVIVEDGSRWTRACGVGAPIAMALARAELERRDECPVGGEHYFEKIDPRDEKQLGMSGWHCVECGKGRD